MTWTRMCGVMLLALAGSTGMTRVVFTQGADAAAQLQAAMHRETVEGDLAGAIAEYRRLAEQARDRTVRARALLRLGAAYERAGREDAAKVYERLVREFGDVAEVGSVARSRLAAMRPNAAPARTTTTSPLSLQRVWGPGAVVNWHSFTRDGRFMTYLDVDSGNLMLRDLEENTSRQITFDGTTAAARREPSYGEAWEHAISPDGRMIAYTFVRLSLEKGNLRQLGTELRVANLDGSQRRTLASWDGKPYIGPPAWTSDQQSLAITATVNGDRSDVLLISLKDPQPRVLLSDPVRSLLSSAFSPDSRHLAVNARKRLGSDDWDVLLIDLENGRARGETRVLLGTDRPEFLLGWSPDGREFVYESHRNGTPSVWRQPMQDGRATGSAIFVREIGSRSNGAIVAADGTLLYVVRPNFRNALLGTLRGDRVADLRSASARYEDVTVALGWSPDARWFAHTAAGDGIVVQDTRGGGEENVRPPVTALRHIAWHPNVHAFVLSGIHDGKNGVHLYDIGSGRTELLVEGTMIGVVGRSGAIYTAQTNGVIEARNAAGTAARVVLRMPDPSGSSLMLTESPDGQTLAAADPYTLWLIPAGGGEPTVRFRPQSQNFGSITAVAWSRDGRSLVLGLSRQGARAPELVRLPVADGAPQQLEIDTPLGDVAWFRSLHTHPTTVDAIAVTPWGWRGEVWRLSNFLPRP